MQTYALMKTVYGYNILGHAIIFFWNTFFTVGKASAAALPRMGRRKTSSTEIMVNTIEPIIMEDQSPMVRELGAMLDNFLFLFSLS